MIDQVFCGDINYSIDLISGLPGLSLVQRAQTLATAVVLKPRPCHISLYDLQIERGTVFGDRYNGDLEEKVGNDVTTQSSRGSSPVRWYKYAAGYLRAKGYEHNEISSDAQSSGGGGKSHQSRHNQIYWVVDGQWAMVCLGSRSYQLCAWRDDSPSSDDGGLSKVVEAQVKARLEENHVATVDPADFFTDVIMKRLQTSEGLDSNLIRKHYGQDVLKTVLRGAALGVDLGLMAIVRGGCSFNPTIAPDGSRRISVLQ